MSLAPPFLRCAEAAMTSDVAQLASVVGRSKRVLRQMQAQATDSAHTHRTIANLLESYARQWDGFATVVTQQLCEFDVLISGVTQQPSTASSLTSASSREKTRPNAESGISVGNVMQHRSGSEPCLSGVAVSLPAPDAMPSAGLAVAAKRVSASVEAAAGAAASAVADFSEALKKRRIAGVLEADEDCQHSKEGTPEVDMLACKAPIQKRRRQLLCNVRRPCS